jgi:hypothetical protein
MFQILMDQVPRLLCHLRASFFALKPSETHKNTQVEEAFGCCLGTVVAHAHIDSSRSSPSASCDSGFIVGKDDWEHVDLFNDALPANPQQSAAVQPVPFAPDAFLAAQLSHPASPPAIAPSRASDQPLSTARADADAARMTALFRRLRRRLERLRRYNRTSRCREAREQVAAMLGAAAAGGCQRIASRAARLLGWTGYLTAATLDDLEQQIDTAEAVWNSCRCVV